MWRLAVGSGQTKLQLKSQVSLPVVSNASNVGCWCGYWVDAWKPSNGTNYLSIQWESNCRSRVDIIKFKCFISRIIIIFKCFIDKTNILCRCVQPRDITAGAILVVRTLITHKSKTISRRLVLGKFLCVIWLTFLTLRFLLRPTTNNRARTWDFLFRCSRGECWTRTAGNSNK